MPKRQEAPLPKSPGDSRKMAQGNEAMLREISALQNSATEISTRMEEVSEGIRKIALLAEAE